MTIKLKILKATLMLRRLGNTYQTKEEQIAEFTEWYNEENEADLDEWIDSLRADLQKTPEELEAEAEEFREYLMDREEEMFEAEFGGRHHRDEWDDLWSDRARSVGAIYC